MLATELNTSTIKARLAVLGLSGNGCRQELLDRLSTHLASFPEKTELSEFYTDRTHIQVNELTHQMELVLDNFAYIKATHPLGKGVRSSKFKYGQHMWYLLMYPNGELDSYKGHMSFYVVGPKDIYAKYNVTTSWGYSFKIDLHSDWVNGWGLQKACKSDSIPLGQIKFKVALTIYSSSTEVQTSHIPAEEVTGPNEVLSNLWDSKYLSDVEILVGNTAIQAHKNVLGAASPVFRAMFGDSNDPSSGDRKYSFAEGLDGCVELSSDSTVEDVTLFLDYLYRGTFPKEAASVIALLHLGDKYQVECLTLRCLKTLASAISVSNCIPILLASARLAETNPKAKDIETRALRFVAFHLPELADNPDLHKITDNSAMMQLVIAAMKRKRPREEL